MKSLGVYYSIEFKDCDKRFRPYQIYFMYRVDAHEALHKYLNDCRRLHKRYPYRSYVVQHMVLPWTIQCDEIEVVCKQRRSHKNDELPF